eukprot:scaffold190503_cov26-Tisochrysis_lutea.AAC.3
MSGVRQRKAASRQAGDGTASHAARRRGGRARGTRAAVPMDLASLWPPHLLALRSLFGRRIPLRSIQHGVKCGRELGHGEDAVALVGRDLCNGEAAGASAKAGTR